MKIETGLEIAADAIEPIAQAVFLSRLHRPGWIERPAIQQGREFDVRLRLIVASEPHPEIEVDVERILLHVDPADANDVDAGINDTLNPVMPVPERHDMTFLAFRSEITELAMFGKLSLAAIPLDQPIPLVTGAVVLVVILAVLAWVVIAGHLPYLWREWITSVDHKRIGVMYVLLASVMLLRGFTDAIMMRAQQALAFQSNGFLPPEHYNQIFSAHGTIMIFFVAMTFVIGLMNLV